MPIDSLHEQKEEIASITFFPPHPPRTETPEYKKTHHKLVIEEDNPCVVCGVRKSTLGDPAQNPCGAKDLETHHLFVEWGLADAMDWRKVAAHFSEVTDEASFKTWLDSEDNMLVLCDVHHRSPELGIHHLSMPDWMAERFALEGYQIAATPKDAAAIEQKDASVISASQHSA